LVLFFLSFFWGVCVCLLSCEYVWRCGHEQWKREERDKDEEQYEEQLKEVNLLPPSLLHTNNGSRDLLPLPWALNCSKGLLPSPGFSDSFLNFFCFYLLLLFLFCVQFFFPCFFAGFLNTVFLAFQFFQFFLFYISFYISGFYFLYLFFIKILSFFFSCLFCFFPVFFCWFS
jgi:hypothetical protein